MDPEDDYYAYLQVDPNADQETIERVYRLLAKKYHPDNRDTGNGEKFNLLTTAYRTLVDPETRAAYDVHYEAARSQAWRALAATVAAGGPGSDARIRRTLLSILYFQRRENPADPGVGGWQLEKRVGLPEKVIEFHVWYLREKGWIARTDTGGYAITAAGVDAVEAEGPTAAREWLIPEKTAENGS